VKYSGGDGTVAVEIDTRDLEAAARRLALENGRTTGEMVEQAARLTLEDVVRTTPPGNLRQKGKATTGKRAVRRSIGKAFVGVRIKHKRREEWPDVVGVYEDMKRGRRLGKEPKKYVDQVKLRELVKRQEARVGLLASNWLPGLYRLGGGKRVPKFITRHRGRGGSYEVSTRGRTKRVVVVNDFPSDWGVSRVMEAAAYVAVRRQSAKMVRSAAFLARRDARRAGFRVR